jgi:protein pelota
MLKTNFERIAYGENDVFYSAKINAIDTLLISDKLFRTKDLNKRKIYNRLLDDVHRKGGETFIFLSLHQSGERLNKYSGVTVILRFEMQL